jgi:hypothetical protein
VFGDAQCTIALSGFTVATSITTISADARTIGIAGVVPSVPNTQSPWALHGYVQSASGERRTIIGQTGLSTFVLQAPFPVGAIGIGASVSVVAGCDKQNGTCTTKYANGINFGGHPFLLPSNIFYTGLLTSRYR